MLPLCHLRPCVAAMASLAEHVGSTLVLCTATQPSLGDLLRTYAPEHTVTELCPQTEEVYDRFRRVTFRQAGILEDEALAERLGEYKQVLCVVNSRKAAQQIFNRLPQEGAPSFNADDSCAETDDFGGNSTEIKGRRAVPCGVYIPYRGGCGCGLSYSLP